MTLKDQLSAYAKSAEFKKKTDDLHEFAAAVLRTQLQYKVFQLCASDFDKTFLKQITALPFFAISDNWEAAIELAARESLHSLLSAQPSSKEHPSRPIVLQ